MKLTNVTLILIAVVAGGAAGFVTAALNPPALSQPALAASEADARLAELAAQQAKLQQAIAELRASQALLASRPERMALNSDSGSAKSAGSVDLPANQDAKAAAAAVPELTVESVLARLSDPNLTYAERSALWEKANKAGLLDAVVKSIEERADREPNNPELKVELGNAYLQEVFATNGMSRGKWALKADAAFDAALELNPQHWEARFTKAVALSNWPAFTGKQGQAIAEFETLVKQQEAGPKQDEYAKTYLYLGNMYQGSGSVAKAIAAWQQGLDLFPDNQDLKQHIADAKKL